MCTVHPQGHMDHGDGISHDPTIRLDCLDKHRSAAMLTVQLASCSKILGQPLFILDISNIKLKNCKSQLLPCGVDRFSRVTKDHRSCGIGFAKAGGGSFKGVRFSRDTISAVLLGMFCTS